MNADQFCHVCQIVISYIDDELLKNETLIEIGDMLTKGCQVLPDVLMEKVIANSYMGNGRAPSVHHLQCHSNLPDFLLPLSFTPIYFR